MWHYKDGKKPPKDRAFLADVLGLPLAVMCIYHQGIRNFIHTNLEEGMVDGQPDPYWGGEIADESAIIAWAELPETPTTKKWGHDKYGGKTK